MSPLFEIPVAPQDVEELYCKRSLFIFLKDGFIRRCLLVLTHTRAFELLILLGIAVNCVTLALERQVESVGVFVAPASHSSC